MGPEHLAVCLSCHTAMNSEEFAVFRNGAKIAHVRCWTLKDVATPLRPVDDVSELTALRPS
jgi:hypothetical protein